MSNDRHGFPVLSRRRFLQLSPLLLASIPTGKADALRAAEIQSGPKSQLLRTVECQVIDDIIRRFGSYAASEEAAVATGKFLARRQELIAEFSTSRGATKEYRETLASDLQQVHISADHHNIQGQESGRNVAIISRAAQEALWTDDLFPRLRYLKNSYLHPPYPRLIRSWGESPHTIMFFTETVINGELDSLTVMVIRRDGSLKNSPFQMARVWQFCEPGSRAQELVFMPSFGEDVVATLPNVLHVGVTRGEVQRLFMIRHTLAHHTAHPMAFQYGQIDTYLKVETLYRKLIGKGMDGKEAMGVIGWVDSQLCRFD